jgi:hypothetical protein
MVNQLRKYFLMVVAGSMIISCNDEPEPSFPFLLEVNTYDEVTKSFHLTQATLVVSAENQAVVTKELGAETSAINVPAREGNYTVTVTKSDYLPYEKVFTASELSLFGTTPLVIYLLDESVAEGLVVFYPFNSSAKDSTTNHRDGVVHGPSPTNDRKGNVNSAYFFDGQDDYINVANHASLNPTSDFTISLWASVSSTQVPHEGTNDILHKWNENADGYPFSISYLNPLASSQQDKIAYARYDGCANVPTSYSPAIEDDEFIHIVLVKQGTNLRHYLNATLIQEFTDNTSCSTSNTADMTIGCRGNLVHFFKGKIDDIRIYNRPITAAEVANLFVE